MSQSAALSREKVDLLIRKLATAQAAIPRRGEQQEPPPLSFAQQRLWFLDQLLDGSPAYNIAGGIRLTGALDRDALERGLGEIVRRHEALRTTFATAAGNGSAPVQVIAAAAGLEMPWVDLSAMAEQQRAAEVERRALAEARQPFDLARGPLLRATLLRLATDSHLLLLTLHHIVADGWSLGVLLRELAALYGAFARGQASPLPELPVQYADYALWQRRRLVGETLEHQLGYWRRQLAGVPPLELATDRPRPASQSTEGARLPLVLPPELPRALGELAQGEGATLFMALLAAFATLLHRYTGQDDLAVGSPVAGRGRREIEGLIGYFANTLALRVDLTGRPSFRGLLARVREVVQDADAHQEVPFEKLVEELSPQRNLTTTPFFQVMLSFDSSALDSVRLPGLDMAMWDIDTGTARFDLTLLVSQTADGLAGSLEYNTDLFDGATVGRLAEHLTILLRGALADPDARLSELPLLGDAERRQVVVEWNRTASGFPRDLTLHGLIEAQVERAPGATALIAGEQRLSYAELNTRANRLAHRLRRLGAGPEATVGICLDRRAELVVAILAALKTGAAYVPLDPAYPRERLAFMLADAGVAVLVTRGELLEVLPEALGGAEVLCLGGDSLGDEPQDNPAVAVSPGALAYLIYTSGSTGRPKGVAIEHASAVTLVQWSRGEFTREEISGVLLATSVCFDLSIFELFVPLGRGGTVILADNALALPGLAARDEVTLINTVPSAITELVRDDALPAGVRTVNLAGEPLRRSLVDRIYARPHVERVLNLFGPSEDTTYSTFVEVPREVAAEPTIGVPVADTCAYLVDRCMQPVPVGVVGELYLGGHGLARGYLGRPGLTASRFVPDPFGERSGGRLYRTGDLARHLGDGEMAFLGRADHQVKVRGFRIELGEIETRLLAHGAVREAVVAVRDDPAPAGGVDRRLVAYVAPREVETAALRSFLAERLPDYMVPSGFVLLDALPLLPNGKVDRKALPAPDWGGESAAYVAPRDPVEEVVAGIWTELLGVERVGVHDNFFELGGHSLRATQVVSRLRQACGVELPLRRLFEAPTVAELAARVTAARGAGEPVETPPIVAEPRVAGQQDLPLSFSQERLWFLDQLEPDTAFYNIWLVLRVAGPLQLDLLERSLNEIVRRQESLRTTFGNREGRPYQRIAAELELPLPVRDLRRGAVDEHETAGRRWASEEVQRPFDLERGPLVRAAAARLAEDEHLLAISFHHVVSDGWSTGVLVRELVEIYRALAQGEVPRLPELPVQYADYARWQRERLDGEVLESHLAYWRQQLADLPSLELPLDRPRPAVETFRGTARKVALGVDLTRDLEGLARRSGSTPFMALLAGFQALLGRLSGQRDIVVGSPIANRGRVETESLIGFFANTLVLRGDLAADPTLAELLGRVRETTLSAYAHQDLPFEKLVEELSPERDLSRNPLFQVMLVLQNQPRPESGIAGLTLEPVFVETEIAKFDLTLFWWEEGGRLEGLVEYNTDLFDAATVQRLMAGYERLLAAMAADGSRRLTAVPLLARAQRHQLLDEWNDPGWGTLGPPAAAVREGVCLHRQIEAQAARTPQAVAVIDGERQMAYAELEERANQLAHALIGAGVGPESLVGICIARNVEMVVALLAVLKAGGAGVALDPAYPEDRLRYIIGDAGMTVLLTDPELAPGLPDHAGTTLCLEPGWQAFAGQRRDPPGVPVRLDNPIYAIYTSGSTGLPKGILVTHRAFGNLIDWQNQPGSGMAHRARTVQFATFGFCVSFQEIFSSWSSGGTLVLADEMARRDIDGLAAFLERWRIERLHMPFAALKHLAEVATTQERLPARLREVISAGEQLQVSPALRGLFERLDDCVLRNQYGASETHVVSDFCLRGDPAAWPAIPPVGRPIANVAIHLLDRAMQPVPIGVSGALYTSGLCDARGYLQDPAMTAEKFVPDPFSSRPGRRLYRTGDLARRLPGGEIEYLGRIDAQVKIRGYRVELGEIDTVLAAQPAVRDVAVVPQEVGSEPRLVAYVVLEGADADADAAVGDLRAVLKKTLPEYMVPAVFVPMDTLPLNANGKLDRDALPVPESLRPDLAAAYVAPRTAVEEVLADIWREVLGVERVGVRDSFFELGGHSLLATQVIWRLRSTFRIDLPLRSLFEAVTVEELARSLAEHEAEPGRSEKIAEILQRIKSMPEEEKSRRLTAGQATS